MTARRLIAFDTLALEAGLLIQDRLGALADRLEVDTLAVVTRLRRLSQAERSLLMARLVENCRLLLSSARRLLLVGGGGARVARALVVAQVPPVAGNGSMDTRVDQAHRDQVLADQVVMTPQRTGDL